MKHKSIQKIIFLITLISFFVGIFTLLGIQEYIWISLIPFSLGILGIIYLTLANRAYVQSFMTSKFGKKLFDNILGFFLLFSILALVNYVAVKRPIVWDFSKAQYSSLTAQTKSILKDLKELKTPFGIKIFADRSQKDAILSLTNLYQNETPSLEVEFIDAQVRSDLVSKYEITVLPALVIEKVGTQDESKTIVVSDLRELAITNALLKVSREEAPLLCFRDSPDLIDQSELGYSGFTTILRQGFFELKLVNLLKEKSIPISCNAFLVWGLSDDLTDDEISKIETYSNLNKPLVVAISPMVNGDKINKFRKYLSDKGVAISNDIVIDQKQFYSGSNGSAPLITEFDNKDINTNLGSQIFIPIGSSVFAPNLTEDEKFISLARSTDDSWAESDLLGVLAGKAQYDSKDFMGPIDLAGAIEKNGIVSLVALGNASLVANKFFQFQSNFRFVLNILYWASNESRLTSVQASVLPEVPVFISATQLKIIFYFSIIFVPLFMFCISIIRFNRMRG